VTPDALVIRDWGQFQSPGTGWEECPYRRSIAPAAALQSWGNSGINKTADPMIIGIVDQSLANWCEPCPIRCQLRAAAPTGLRSPLLVMLSGLDRRAA
jgi:hypothetical protein